MSNISNNSETSIQNISVILNNLKQMTTNSKKSINTTKSKDREQRASISDMTSSIIKINKTKEKISDKEIKKLEKYKKILLNKINTDEIKEEITHPKGFTLVNLPMGTQTYKLANLSSYQSYEKIVNYGNDRFLESGNFGCGWNNETWLALDLTRAIDYISDERWGRLIGFKINKPDIYLVKCDDSLNKILPRTKLVLRKIIPLKKDLDKEDAKKLIERMGDRYLIPNLIFNLDNKEKEEQINFLINLIKFLFGLSGGGDITNEDSLYKEEINMNVKNQQKMLIHIQNMINLLIDNKEFIIRSGTDEIKKKIDEIVNWTYTGNLTALQFTEIYLERFEELNSSQKELNNQRISFLLFDRIAAHLMCYSSTFAGPAQKKPEKKKNIYKIKRRYYGWYVPNVESCWADGGLKDFRENGKIITKYREKDLEEIMIWNFSALTKKEISSEARLVSIIEYLIKNPNYKIETKNTPEREKMISQTPGPELENESVRNMSIKPFNNLSDFERKKQSINLEAKSKRGRTFVRGKKQRKSTKGKKTQKQSKSKEQGKTKKQSKSKKQRK